MPALTITLPDAIHQYLKDQMQANDYETPDEYFRDLIRADQKRRAKNELEQSLLAALAEGDAEEAHPEWLETLHHEIHTHTKKPKSS